MKEENKQTLDFYDFVVMVASDQKAASQVLEREPGWLHIKSSTDETAIHYLAIENDIEAVKFLLAQGAEVDSRDCSEGTPLIHAAKLGYTELCLLLIKNGADVNAKDNIDWTPMHYAARAGKPDLLDELLRAGGRADIYEEFDDSVVDVAPPEKRDAICDVLKKHGYSITVSGPESLDLWVRYFIAKSLP